MIFLGHVVSANGIKSDPAKVDAIVKLPAPADVTSLRSFLGMINYFRIFIPHFAEHAAVLNALLTKGVSFVWTQSHQEAFNALKQALASAATIYPFDPDLPVVVQTDASGVAVGAVLLQKAGSTLRPVAFFSKKLDKHEFNYPTQKKECLAIVLALKKWEHYLRGRVFDLETDHRSLLELKKSKDPTRQLARWFDLLAEYDYQPVYRPGKSNQIADCLSRLVPEATTQLAAIESVPAYDSAFSDKVKNGYAADPYMGVVHRALVMKEKVEAKYSKRVALFTAVDGLLFFGSRLALPTADSVRFEVLKEAHDAPAAGHLGIEATYAALARRFFWPRMFLSVTRFVKGCLSCQKAKPAHGSPQGLLHPLPVPDVPWESIGMDFITGLPDSASGYNSILTIVDRFSKMCHFLPTTKSVSAQGVADMFTRDIFRLHGLPKSIVSDRDPKFTSDFWQALFKRMGTTLLMSTTDHPQTDGQSERANGTIIQMLRAFCMEKERDWPTFLPLLEFAVNNTPHKPALASPFEICYGKEPLLPLDLVVPSVVPRDSPPLSQRLRSIQTFVRDNLLLGQAKMAEKANEGRKPVEFTVGDSVLLRSDHASSHVEAASNNKLKELFNGPHPVTAVGTNTVTLDLPKEMTVHPTVNVSKVKKFVDPVVPLPQPGPVGGRGKDDYEVDRIITHKSTRRGTQYLVRWTGWGPKEDKWLYEEDLKDAKEVFQKYHDSLSSRAG